MERTLGGERLGSGNKMKVDLHGYERSTQNLSYLWRSTMAPGTLVPFISELALPGDTWDFHLNMEGMTHPTIGPLLGSYKAQHDVFVCPIRLYNALAHNNTLGIGLKMQDVKLPIMTLTAEPASVAVSDLDNSQINASCLLSYLGLRGVGYNATPAQVTRSFNAVPLLAYWDIYKNYYANKMEEIGAVIHTPADPINKTVTSIKLNAVTLPQAPTTQNIQILPGQKIDIAFTGAQPNPAHIILHTVENGDVPVTAYFSGFTVTAGVLTGNYMPTNYRITAQNWKYTDQFTATTGKPAVVTFPLDNIDQMRKNILRWTQDNVAFEVMNGAQPTPYRWLGELSNGIPNTLQTQEGLALKTYQSDLFNNWLNTEAIDEINQATAVNTSGGSFQIDALRLSEKVRNVMNRIVVSGGSLNDWIMAVYDHQKYMQAETPMYMGGLIRELIFQEVVSNSSASEADPLGTLAGKGVMSNKRKGGNIIIKVDEPSYIIGIVSLTPRIDYSQGNKWDLHLKTWDDFHKPGLDQLGFQELITEQMAWWDTQQNAGSGGQWITRSAGKQPAWINYMTNVNQTRGNFAVPFGGQGSEMFMTLNRRYEYSVGTGIKDLTTYIDPSKYNNIFAQTSLDAQNFWIQISVDITARRKMSNKVMPV